jgi:succinate dehydrogenase / fumarate reductase cytochrome b subunit
LVQALLGSAIGVLFLFGWTVALMFHLFSGIRHLFWDFGRGFEAPAYNNSAWMVIAATVVATVLVWIVGLAAW